MCPMVEETMQYGRENRDTECYTEAMSHDSLENKESSLVLDKREKTRGKEKSPNINTTTCQSKTVNKPLEKKHVLELR